MPANRLVFSSTEPVLCESYHDGSPGSLSLAITDPNGRVQTVPGIAGFSYKLPVQGDATSARFAPVSATATYGPLAQCYALPYSTLALGAADQPAPGNALVDIIFGNSFEVVGPPSQRADLRVEILDGDVGSPSAYLRRNLQATIGSPVQYRIRVRNAGPATANGIRLKEFVADTAAPAPMLLPLVEAQGWTCRDRGPGEAQSAPGTDCGSGSGVLAVGGAGFSLAGGASRTYTLTRNFPASVGGQPNAADGNLAVLGAAVFFSPTDATGQGDVGVAENLASALFQLTANPGPTISCAGLQNLSLTEADSPRSFPYSCTVTDPDGIATFTATSSNPTSVPVSLGAESGGSYPLTINIPAYAFTPNGSPATITLAATDSLGAAATPVAVTVAVSQVNDAPSFSMPIKRIELRQSTVNGAWEAQPVLKDAAGAVISPTPDSYLLPNCESSGDATCTLVIPMVMQAVDAGDPNESGQTVESVTSNCSGDLGEFSFGGQPIGYVDTGAGPAANISNRGPVPASSVSGGDTNFGLTFTYRKAWGSAAQVSCYLKIRDNGTPAATSPDSDTLTRVIFSRFASS
nr:hypothetical protein [Lysobacter sp. CAU 1642]